MPSDAMHRELELLVEALGEVLEEQLGQNLFELEAQLHDLAAARRDGDGAATAELRRRVEALHPAEARAVARAYSCYFDLANLAEDRQWTRVVRERERAAHPRPRPESLAEAIAALREAGLDAQAVRALVGRLMIEPVFTAHPTEAKRRTNRMKLNAIRGVLNELGRGDLLPREEQQAAELLRAELTTLWRTDLLRRRRPTVLEEVDVGLYYARTLWSVVPRLYADLEAALASCYPGEEFELPVFLRFGSWIGGDRDGNPAVTAPITRETLRRHRAEALALHLAEARRLSDMLTASTRQAECSEELQAAVEHAAQRYRGVREPLDRVADEEVYRRWLTIIGWRLERALDSAPFDDPLVGAYLRPDELQADLALMADSLRQHGGKRLARAYLEEWITRCRVFGFHLLRLDIREDSAAIRAHLDEALLGRGIRGFARMNHSEQQAVLLELLSQPDPEPPPGGDSGELATLMELLADAAEVLGPEALGTFLISMCHGLADVLSVLWLARQAGLAGPRAVMPLPIVPLMETIEDLRQAPAMLRAMLGCPAYAEHLAACGRLQYVMIGYSDSTKDGGYLAAQWSLYRAQAQMRAVAEPHGVRLVFFHGRGGALGRGGGPAADSIRSLPVGTVDAAIRLTEQGEVLSERYDDAAIGYRHLEQLCGATLLVSASRGAEPEQEWIRAADQLAESAYRTYRELVDVPGFTTYFRGATPIEAIEALPLASRPSRRRAMRGLRDLRAIPWTFAWTQSRHLLPAWYGAGTALAEYAERHGWELLREMYGRWPFFTVLIDHAALALAKSDLGLIRVYAERVDPPELGDRISRRIVIEGDDCLGSILEVTGQTSLLERIPWLAEAVARRSPFVDALCFLQAEALSRIDALPDDAPAETRLALDGLVRLTIGGIAAGLRSTG